MVLYNIILRWSTLPQKLFDLHLSEDQLAGPWPFFQDERAARGLSLLPHDPALVAFQGRIAGDGRGASGQLASVVRGYGVKGALHGSISIAH